MLEDALCWWINEQRASKVKYFLLLARADQSELYLKRSNVWFEVSGGKIEAYIATRIHTLSLL